ncbi:MAG: hypothetical protein J6V83_02610 [Clostridia bacterium]|nr:hypothetical protein [Clostridia bacterium]
MNYLIPAVFISTFIIGAIKKINLFDSYVEGIGEAVKLTIKLIPYLCAVFMAIRLMQISGLSIIFANFINPLFVYLGIPKELIELLVIRPLSGSGSIAILENVYSLYGADSYVGLCASVIMGSTETVFYVTAVYFSVTEDKKTGVAIGISLIATFIGAVVACALCRLIV